MPHITAPRPLSPTQARLHARLAQEVQEEERERLQSLTCECQAPKTPGEFWCPRCLEAQGDFLEEDLEAMFGSL